MSKLKLSIPAPGSLATSCNPSSGAVLCEWIQGRAGPVATLVPEKGDCISKLYLSYHISYSTRAEDAGRPKPEESLCKCSHESSWRTLGVQGRGFESRSDRSDREDFFVTLIFYPAIMIVCNNVPILSLVEGAIFIVNVRDFIVIAWIFYRVSLQKIN